MEYFKLEDQHALIDLQGRKPKFYSGNLLSSFLKGTQDKLTEIIHELEIRNFKVPGIEVEFYLNTETGVITPWKIFSNELNLLITNSSIIIKGKEISIYDDGSGSLNVYALNDWESDKKEFMFGKKFHRKMDNQSRLHLGYSLYRGFYNTNASDSREYAPEGDEPKTYILSSIEQEVYMFLCGIFENITNYKIPSKVEVFKEPEPIKLTNEWFKDKKIYAYNNIRYANDNNKNIIKPGWRLLSLSMKLPDHPLSEQMQDGFIYMELNNNPLPVDSKGYNHIWRKEECIMYEVKPLNYNQFFVIDASVFNENKAKWFSKNPEKSYLPDNLVDDYRKLEASTMIPINEYHGQYKKPIVITNRILWQDELEKCEILELEN